MTIDKTKSPTKMKSPLKSPISSNDLTVGSSDKSRLIAVALAGLVTGAFVMFAFVNAGRGDWPSYLLSNPSINTKIATAPRPITTTTPIHLKAILHYATSKITPQQTLEEITESFNVLRNIAPCNFLVFGLGYDSLMWASLNSGGKTIFLEESPEWVQIVLKEAPFLHAKTVPYRTQLQQADQLMATYRDVPECLPNKAFLRNNIKCKLALENLPEEVYDREWDVIMIDAPRGYFNEAPGRMAAIYSAAVMARNRKRPGNTHVYLHDIDRKVEENFAKEFLCLKYRVGAVGRLWHFEIPPAKDNKVGTKFC